MPMVLPAHFITPADIATAQYGWLRPDWPRSDDLKIQISSGWTGWHLFYFVCPGLCEFQLCSLLTSVCCRLKSVPPYGQLVFKEVCNSWSYPSAFPFVTMAVTWLVHAPIREPLGIELFCSNNLRCIIMFRIYNNMFFHLHVCTTWLWTFIYLYIN